jgi:hypothetical protein
LPGSPPRRAATEGENIVTKGNPLRRLIGLAGLAGALSLVPACSTPTAYQPLSQRSPQQGGYSEQRIDANRFRVSFAGNSLTSRKTVENYLLLRAAQLTLENGFDGFTMVSRATDPHVRTSVTREPFGPGPWGYWGPSWRYRDAGLGWRSWDPWLGQPFWGDTVDVQSVTDYAASAEIVMFRGSGPAAADSFDARQVVQNLGPTARMPA